MALPLWLSLVASLAVAGPSAADRNAQFWGEWNALKVTPKWKRLESVTTMNTAPAPADGKTGNRDQYIFNLGVDRPADAARFMSDVVVNRVEGADAALATVVNLRTPPAVRRNAAKLVPVKERAQVTGFVERLPPARFFTDLSTPRTTSAFLPRADAPPGFEPVAGGSIGCRIHD